MRYSLVETEFSKDTLVGVKIVCKQSLKTRLLNTDKLKQILVNTTIEGLRVHNSNIIGTNGNIRRYDRKGNRVTILFKTDEGFILYHNENIVAKNSKDTVELVKKYGISNGKLVKQGNREFISSINGEYEIYEKGSNKNDSKRINGGNREQEGINTNRGNTIRCVQREEEKRQGINYRRSGRDTTLHGLKECGYRNNVDADRFYQSIEKAKASNKHGTSVDLHSIEDYKNMNCIVFDDGKAGVAVDKGNIVSVFKHQDSNIKGFMGKAMKGAIINGGKKLDCYSIHGMLPSMYVRYGFIPVCKIKFNREFAPDGWDYERDGEPDIVFMMHNGDKVEELDKNQSNYKNFSDYTDEEIPYIEDLGDACAYDRATDYLNRKILEKEQENKNIKSTWLFKEKGIKGILNTIVRGRKSG